MAIDPEGEAAAATAVLEEFGIAEVADGAGRRKP
jgi:hypothetical protein